MIKLKTLLNDVVVKNRQRDVETFEKHLQTKYSKYLDTLMFYYDDLSKGIFLSDIYIKKPYRGHGYGTQVMNDLIRFADTYQLPISLIPSTDDKSNQKLIGFYQKFGFVQNTNNDLFDLDSMYRLPKS